MIETSVSPELAADRSKSDTQRELLEKRGFIVALARRKGLSPPDAEDAAQDVLIKALQAVEHNQFDENNNLDAWLNIITQNALIDRGRAARRRASDRTENLDTHSYRLAASEKTDPETTVAEMELAGKMFEYIGRLPLDLQEVVFKELAGKKQAEIAKDLQIFPGTVSKRLAKAKKMLVAMRAAEREKI